MAEVVAVVERGRCGRYYLHVQTPPKRMTVLRNFPELIWELARAFHEHDILRTIQDVRGKNFDKALEELYGK
jgi:hypothetical protein